MPHGLLCQPVHRHGRSPRLRLSHVNRRRFVEALWRSARLSQTTARADDSGREHVSGRLVFGMADEAWRFVGTPGGLVRPDASDKSDVYQEPGTW